MLTPRAFWFLRHGETDWNARNLSQGNVDVPLNEVGLAQARTAAEVLRTRGIRSVVTSPLSRAYDTAAIVGERIGVPLEVEEELREVAFGVQEGQPMAEWFDDWVAGAFTPEGRAGQRAARPRGRGDQRGADPAGAGAGGGARRAVPRVAGRNGLGAERPHAQRPAILLRAWHALDADSRILIEIGRHQALVAGARMLFVSIP